MPGTADYYAGLAASANVVDAVAEHPKQNPASKGSHGALSPRLFLRVPDMESQKFKKCINLMEIFQGVIPVTFYDSSTSTYHTQQSGMMLSDFILDELRSILGDDSVVFRK